MKIPKRTSATMRNCHSLPDTSALLLFYVDQLDAHVIQLVNLIALYFTSGEQLNHYSHESRCHCWTRVQPPPIFHWIVQRNGSPSFVIRQHCANEGVCVCVKSSRSVSFLPTYSIDLLTYRFHQFSTMSNRSRGNGGGGEGGEGDHRSTPPNIDTMHSLKVDNLTYRTRVEDLRKKFEKFGPIGDIYIPRDQFSRSSRGYAFIRFVDFSSFDFSPFVVVFC